MCVLGLICINIYELKLDEPASAVFGSLRDGVFDGKIITPEETFYVERSHKYPLSSTNASRHSVIYSEQDVHDPYHQNRTGMKKATLTFIRL